MLNKPPGSPDCYGTHLWSAIAKECTGGPDAAYTHPANGTHVRERCRWFQSCAGASAQTKAAVVPASNLTAHLHPVQLQARPGFLPSPPPRPLTATFQPQQQPYHHPTTLGQPWIAQQGPQAVPLPYQAPGAQMPSYLAVPEPAESGHWFKRLLRETFRSMGKATGHTIASFFDHTPIVNHRTPEE